jgi:hypothetical protein
MEPAMIARLRHVAAALAWAALATGCESIFGIGDLPLPGGDGGAQDASMTGDDGGQFDSGIDTGGSPLDGTSPTDGTSPNDGTSPTDGTSPNDGTAPTDGTSPTDSSSPTDSTPPADSPTSTDSPTWMDGAADSPSSDARPPIDSAMPPSDAGDSGLGCYANAPFTPVPWSPPSTFPDPVCNSAQIAAYLACFPNCATFRADANNASCLACIETDVGAAAHGPIITNGGQPIEVNFGGCVAHYDGHTTAGSCGYLENNANDCDRAECATCSDFANPQAGGATDQCVAAAFGVGGRCSADQVTQMCTNELADGGVAAPCGDLNTFLGAWCGAPCTPVAATIPPHGGAACAGTGTCFPHDETAFTPAWKPALGAHLGVCTPTQVSAFYTACLDTASTPTTCSAWTQNAANTTCFGCLYTDSAATSYGALIGYSQEVVANEAGCIALVEPCNQPCAEAIMEQFACEDAACGSTDCADPTTYSTCANQADSCTACSGYANAAACSSLITGAQHPAEAACNLNATTFQALYTSVATFICGT